MTSISGLLSSFVRPGTRTSSASDVAAHKAIENAEKREATAGARAQNPDQMRQSVFKSEQAYTEFKAQQIAQERDGAQIRDAPAASKVSMDTNHGDVEIDLDEYYNGTQNKNVDLDKVPLFMPSAENLKALSAHASSRLQELLEEYDIPTAPEQITYDNQGKMQLPDGYPYTDQLQQALEENPGLSRELRDLNSMSSVFAKMQESLPFLEAYGKAGSSAEAQKGVDQYSYLFR